MDELQARMEGLTSVPLSSLSADKRCKVLDTNPRYAHSNFNAKKLISLRVICGWLLVLISKGKGVAFLRTNIGRILRTQCICDMLVSDWAYLLQINQLRLVDFCQSLEKALMHGYSILSQPGGPKSNFFDVLLTVSKHQRKGKIQLPIPLSYTQSSPHFKCLFSNP